MTLVIVPLMVVMSGSFAYSAFTGSVETSVHASAGYLAWEQTVTSNYIYQKYQKIVCNYENNNEYGQSGGKTKSGPSATSQNLTVSNLGPGNWVEFNVTVDNTGTEGFILSGYTVFTSVENSGDSYHNLQCGYQQYNNYICGKPLKGNEYSYSVCGIPSGSVSPGHNTTYHVYVGLGENCGYQYLSQKSTFTLDVSITVVADP